MDMAEAVGFNPNIVYGVVHTRSDLKNPDRIGDFNQTTTISALGVKFGIQGDD